MQSRTLVLDGPVHYMDFGGSGPTLVLVHGLGGSHHNWLWVGEKLARHARVVAVDLVGFGLTPLAGRSANVHALQVMLDRFIQAVSPQAPVILMGNSMGGCIAVLQAARNPQRVSGLVLVNPAQPRARDARMEPAVFFMFAMYAIPGLGEFYLKRHSARVDPETQARGMLKLCCGDLSRYPEGLVSLHVQSARERYERMPWARKAFMQAARSMVWLLQRKKHFHALARSIRVPTLLMQGDVDRLVPVANSRELARERPDWTYVEYAGMGHTPMMERPEEFVATVEAWLEGAGRAVVSDGAHVTRAAS